MRSPVASLAATFVVLVSISASAQAPPPDTVTEVIRQKAKQGTQAQYEAARKKHMAWHKAQNDPWAWDVFEITTGPDTGITSSSRATTSGRRWSSGTPRWEMPTPPIHARPWAA